MMLTATSDGQGTAEPASTPATWLRRVEWDRMAAGVVAAILVFTAIGQPLWKMTLLAPQYPGGLHMTAYGDRFEGDVREINNLNHYIGMKPIEADDVKEMRLFRPGMVALAVALLVLSIVPLAHRLKVFQAVAIWLVPVTIVADLQWWLYRFGHSMDPLAPLRLPAFTPRVVGTTKVMNFHNEAAFNSGFWLIVAAVAVISLGPSLLRAIWELPRSFKTAAAGGALLLAVVGGDQAQAAPPIASIAELIAAAPVGGAVSVPPGVYREQLVIEKSVVLRGGNRAVIDGGGKGDVIVVKADGVEIDGFTVRGSGGAVFREPAAIRLLGHGAVITDNRIEDVYFGIHIQGGGHHEIGFNTIRPGRHARAEWRGHAISLWNSEGNVIRRNEIRDAKEGIFLSFSNRNYIHGNSVSHSRFGIHYMNAKDNRFTENVFTENLAGALVMQSKGLFLRGNEFSNNKHGATAIGLLFKDVDDLWVEDNRIIGNGTGLSLETTPFSPEASATFHRNVVALNRVGLALTTTTAATFYENSFVDNARQVSGRGTSLMGAMPGHETVPAAAPAPVAQPGPAAQVASTAHDAHASDGADRAATPASAPAAPATRTTATVTAAAARNRWSAEGRGNYWSDYAGYDRDGDGIGDRPYRPTSAFESLRDRNAAVDLFRYTPAQQAVDAAGRLFPVVKPEVLIEDTAPLIALPTPLPRRGDARGLLLLAAALTVGAALPAWRLRGRARRAGRPALKRPRA